MTDNGAAMQAEEFRAGLHALGILHETTLPYSPIKTPSRRPSGPPWKAVSGVLENVADLTLDRLNEITQVWVEQSLSSDPRRDRHATAATLSQAADVGRACPDSANSTTRLRCTVTRRQRRSDGTLSLAGKRFELPSRYRHLERPAITGMPAGISARSDLIDPHTQAVLCSLLPG